MSSRLLLVTLALLLAACTGDRDSRKAAEEAAARSTTAARAASGPAQTAPAPPARGVFVDCSWHSEATFPRPFTDPRNIVVGPLILVGAADAARQPPALIRELGGWKSPLLVKAGHTVTVRLPEASREFAGLGYGPLLQGWIDVRDAHHTITFIPCPRKEPTYGSVRPTIGSLTFWSGAIVVNRAPACVPLDFYVDDELSPRRVVVSIGARRCESSLVRS